MMTRLEKKCVVGSAGLHATLLLVLFFGSAFSNQEKVDPPLQVIQIVGAIATDKPISTGGSRTGSANPAPMAQAPAQPPAAQTPVPQPPAPQPEPPQPKPQQKPKEAAKPKQPEKVEKVAEKEPTVPTSKSKSKETVDTKPLLKPTVRDNAKAIAEAKAQAKRAEEARQAKEYAELKRGAEAQREKLLNEFGKQRDSIGNGTGTVVEPLGDGGQAFVPFGALIGEIYKSAVYQSRPQGDEDASAVIRVIISRNGTVLDAKFVRRTGNPSLDKAVERAIREIRRVPPFPPEAKDSERTFNISIGFQAKRLTG